MTISFADLIPLQPLLIATLTVVLVMSAVAVKRNYVVAYRITLIGLIFAGLASFYLMPTANYQVTPLLIINAYSLFFTGVICLTAAGICVFSFSYFLDLQDDKEEYFLLLGLATIGAIVLVSSNHFVSMIIGIETISMSLYGMVAYPVQNGRSAAHALEAAVKYLVLSAAASGFMLFGMALIYAQNGTLEFTSLTNSLSNESFSITALILLFSGLAFKLSLAPFHIWTPDVYEGSPLPSTIYLATIGKAVIFVVLLRVVVSTEALSLQSVSNAIVLVACISIILGNLLALLQKNIKRILSYSSIAHMGYLLIALLASLDAKGTISTETITIYLVAYIIMSVGAFGVASVSSSSDAELDNIEDYKGLFWRDPWLACIFTGMLLSLAGIPLTVGFIGKFYVFFAGVESELWGLLLILVIGSGIGLYYYLRIVYTMLLSSNANENSSNSIISRNFATQAVLALTFLLLLLFGVYPAPLTLLVESISSSIL
tara:strand:- start:2171 stop:3631 length:1461 start_codon:yes stop_codon:yes gene_type:complete